MKELTPQEIVTELDRYIVGQSAAKRAVAVAIRNRWRRLQLSEPLRSDVAPKNILMIGPTGVGKTEIARRIAKLVNAPFIKVEATRYTEVGYHGRDVESMVRDLLELAVKQVQSEQTETVRALAEALVEERLLELLQPQNGEETEDADDGSERRPRSARSRSRSRERLRAQLRAGVLDDTEVKFTVEEKPSPTLLAGMGIENMDVEVQRMFESLLPTRSRDRRMPIREARRQLFAQEADRLIDRDKTTALATQRAEQRGIVFIDEIDKIIGTDKHSGPDVSRQGVQRDLLPIVEGTTVNSRHGPIRTDHILFIAAGAFHDCSPSDLMPELQGRFPIRVTLDDLSEADFVRILLEPHHSLLEQQTALLATDGLRLSFTDDAVAEMARLAYHLNRTTVNIGARRLHTILEKVVEEATFSCPSSTLTEQTIDAAYVRRRLADIIKDEDMSRYIL